jgi:hypothetical protein
MEEERMEGDIEEKMERMKLEKEKCRSYRARSSDDDPKGRVPSSVQTRGDKCMLNTSPGVSEILQLLLNPYQECRKELKSG